jgi:hypothetical protein
VARDEERKARSGEPPMIGGLPDFPGIVAAMRLSPGLAVHLRGLADELTALLCPQADVTVEERSVRLMDCSDPSFDQ